jgi:hypothetical protein
LRRRALANCIIPTCIAGRLTISNIAVLSVIAGAVIDHGQSNMSLPELAARARRWLYHGALCHPRRRPDEAAQRIRKQC